MTSLFQYSLRLGNILPFHTIFDNSQTIYVRLVWLKQLEATIMQLLSVKLS